MTLDELKLAAETIERARLRAIEIVCSLGLRGVGDAQHAKPEPDIARLEISGDDAILHWVYALEDEGWDNLSRNRQQIPAALLLVESKSGSVGDDPATQWISNQVEEKDRRLEAEKVRQQELEKVGRKNFMAAIPDVIKELKERQKAAIAQSDGLQAQILQLLALLAPENESNGGS